MEGFSRQQTAETNRTKTKTMATDSNPGQNTLRCHHCAGPLSMKMETSEWTVAPFIRDSFSMIGTAVGGTTSAFYGFNHVMPVVRRWVKGPMWLHFLVGAPPVIVFSSACAGLAGGAVPAIAQLASSSYHAAISSHSQPSPSSISSHSQPSPSSRG
ncbi:hypothetical protein KPL70_009017 [Citrus sinensis]|uniref:uncharacterized protein LOC102612476 n=1 Tax=Citrus sinensis TaxID=2711 RepID=UPI0021976F6A|nr:uncharacterized protein LOC102612476 [Citrus sinensis]KAH9728399.1 hypothetical protein KPL70_009017 [Citrus sinensis]